MRKRKITWFDQAERDLQQTRKVIAQDSPKTARRFIKRLRESVNRLRMFPQSGWVVEELDLSYIREILFGNYRIIYEYYGYGIGILAVRHAAQRLGKDVLKGNS